MTNLAARFSSTVVLARFVARQGLSGSSEESGQEGTWLEVNRAES